MKLSMKPLDTFFFRDGKPFSRGEQTEAVGIFPPFPSTLYGALRTAYISEKGWDKFENEDELVKTVIGTKRSHGKFNVKGVFLERKSISEIVYFALPMDLVNKKNKITEEKKTFRLTFEERTFSSNFKFDKVLACSEPDLEYKPGGLLESGALKSYLLSEISSQIQYFPIFRDEYLAIEPKVGIERDLRNPENKEGRLYRVDMMRLDFSKNYQLLVDVQNIELPRKGVIKIGGENRSFSYEQTDVDIFSYNEEEKDLIINSINTTKKFRLYCATPIIWSVNENTPAWKAEWMDGAKDEKYGIKCKILTAAIGKYINIGGWDMAKGSPKTMYRAIPAGSVYYLELELGTGEEVFDMLHYQNISANRANEGFGLTLIGIF